MEENASKTTSVGRQIGDFYHYKLENVPMCWKKAISMPFIGETVSIDYEDIYYLSLNNLASDTVKAKHAITFLKSNQSLMEAPVSIFMKNIRQNNDSNESVNSTSFLVQEINMNL